MNLAIPRVSGLAALVTAVISVGAGVGLFVVSGALHLRSPHPATSETLGWASFGAALVLVSLPSLSLLRAKVVRAVNPVWICLLVLVSIPAGFGIMHLSGPSWFNADVAGAVVTVSLAALAYSAAVTGLVAVRRGQTTNPGFAYGLCGGFAFLILGLAAWTILFFE